MEHSVRDNSVPVTPSESDRANPQPPTNPLLFWLWFGVAMILYALVLLSPKLAERERLSRQIHSVRTQVANETRRLKRLQTAAISFRKHSPEKEAQANKAEDRVDLTPIKVDEHGREILPLESSQSSNDRSASSARNNPPPSRINQPKRVEWTTRLCLMLSERPNLRGALFLGVLALILKSFGSSYQTSTVIKKSHDSEETEPVVKERSQGWISRFMERYKSPLEIDFEALEKQLQELAEKENEWESDALPIDVDEEDSADSKPSDEN